MRRRRKKKSATSGEVELNMAAMLDMAFQLLAFFILTFRPSPVEAQVSLRVPNIAATSSAGATSEAPQEQEDFGLPLSLRVFSTPEGELSRFEFESQGIDASGNPAQDMANLDAAMKQILKNSDFKSLMIYFSEDLAYERMIQTLVTCSNQTGADGQPLTNISINRLK
jgi:hypothetical protein